MTERRFARVAARGVAITGGVQVLRLAIQLATLVVLSRLLLPAEFGIVVMVTAIIGLAEVLRDFGLSAAAVQARDISRVQKSNLFWINLTIGLMLTGCVFFLGTPISEFYGNAQVVGVVQILSVTFALNGLCAQSKAHLLRSFRYGSASGAELTGQVVGFIAAVFFAIEGYGYWTLVWQQLVASSVTSVAFLAMAGWVPGIPRFSHSIKSLLNFGTFFTLTQIMVYISANASSVAIGKILGPFEVGLYSRAFQVASLPLNQISTPATNVALATLSRLLDDKRKFTRFLVRGQVGLSHPVISAFMFIAAFSEPLVQIIFGRQWLPMAPILTFLCIGGSFQVLSYSTYWCFVSTGNTRSNFNFAVLSRSILLVVGVGCAFAGPVACAVGYAIYMAIFWPIGIWWVSKFDFFRPGELIRPGIRAVFGYSLCALAALNSYLLTGPLLIVGVGLVIYVVVFGFYSLGSPKFRADVMSIVDIASLVLKRRGSSG